MNVKIHPMHDTSPAHQQGKKQEYQIDYLQRLVDLDFRFQILVDVDVDVDDPDFRQ